MFDSKIESVKVEKLDLNLECYYDLLNRKGIRLSSSEAFDKKNNKIYNGLQSEFFASDFGDDNAFSERYSCKCKKYIGKMYTGITCEECNTQVEYNDTDLSKTGWIIIDNFSVISPIFTAKLIDALGSVNGEKILDKIIEVDYDEEGNQLFSEKDQLLIKKHPYIHKGLIWFKDNILEVLEFYEKRKPTKMKLFKELKEDIPIIFTNCIPVYSSVLRTELPGVKGNKLFKMKINTIYQSIIKISNYINKFHPDDIDNKKINTINMQLHDIQRYMLEIFNDVYKSLAKKKGIILGKVVGEHFCPCLS